MARSVYADPFGAYIGGYDTGAQREQQLQQNVRQARDTDWNYYNMKPIELETAQRNNAFQAYADPYQRQVLPYGVTMAKNNAFMSDINAAAVPSFYGMIQPTVDALSRQYGNGYTGTPGGYTMYGPNGEPVSAPITPELTNAYNLRDEYYKREDANRAYGLDLGQYNVSSMNAQTQAANTDAYGRSITLQEQRAGGAGGAGYAPGSVLHQSMFGTGAVTAPTAAPMDAPAPAAPANQATDAVRFVIGKLAQQYGKTPDQIIAAFQQQGYTPQQIVQAYATQQSSGQPLPAAYTPAVQ